MRQRYSIDDERVVVHGVGDSAGFALSVAFTHRDRVRGAIVVDGALAQRPPENRPEYPLQLLFAGNEQGRGFRRVRATVDGLRKMKYPVVFVPTTQKGAGYPAEETVGQFARWLDSLDAF